MKKLVSGLLFLALIVAIVLYAAGTFTGEQVEPGRLPEPKGLEPPAATAEAERAPVDVWEDAVGTVASRTRVTIEAQVTARVRQVHAEAGEHVDADKPLVVLDDREFQARKAQADEGLEQAKASRSRAVQAQARAEAALEKARKTFERVKALKAKQAATEVELEAAESAFLQAQASVAEAEAAVAAADAHVLQATQVVEAAKIAVDHATILAPLDGVVATEPVEPGDLAWPGKPLMEILDPDHLRLEAQVREGLITSINQGDELEVHLPALGRVLAGTVAEVCPTADPRSRTFRVRVDFDRIPGVHPGMFGRLRIPLGEREVVHVPKRAIRETGQLRSVLVQDGDRWERRLVTTGRSLGDGTVEVLSGLAGGETVGLEGADG